MFLGRLVENCPYALPYIPKDDSSIPLGAERIFALFIRFQAKVMLLKTQNYNIDFCWLWFQNVFRLLRQPSYQNQNFCHVLREFLMNVKEGLMKDNPSEFMKMLNSLNSLILPKLERIDPSKSFLQAYIQTLL